MRTAANSTYRFGDTDLAAQRLRLLAEVFEPATRDCLLKLVPRNPARIADLGCGPGCTTRLLAEVFPSATVRGLDNSARFIAIAAQSPQPRLAFETADVTQTLPDGPYDLVYARYLLTHVMDFERAIRLWSGALSPRGLIVIEENEWIRTDEPAFSQYLAIVAAMLADAGQMLYVGAELGAVDRRPFLEKVSSQVVPIGVSATAAAGMFLLNLRCWRDQPFIRANYPVAHVNALEQALQDLAAGHDTRSAITFGRRSLTLARADS
jgi:SAM-dependent methyltransferase